MLRGYRRIIIAAFGWLSLVGTNESKVAPVGVSSANPASQGAVTGEARQAAPKTIPAPKAPETESRDAGCADREDRRESDLCAQWKAADAAFDGARAAERQTMIGWVGLFLGFVTMGAAIAAAWFAKEAARHTEASVTATELAVGPDLEFIGYCHVTPSGNSAGIYALDLRIVIGNKGTGAAHSLHFSKIIWGGCNARYEGIIPDENLLVSKTIDSGDDVSFDFRLIEPSENDYAEFEGQGAVVIAEYVYLDRFRRRESKVGLIGKMRFGTAILEP